MPIVKKIKKIVKSEALAWVMTATGMFLTVVGTIMIPASRLIEYQVSRTVLSPLFGRSRDIIFVTRETLKEFIVGGIGTIIAGIPITLAGTARLFRLHRAEQTKNFKKQLRDIGQQKLEAPKKAEALTLENENTASNLKITSSAKKIIIKDDGTFWEGNTVPTKGGGHCAVEATCGEEKDNFCECPDVQNIRDTVADLVKKLKKNNEAFAWKKGGIELAVKVGIEQTLLETENESRLIKYAGKLNFPHLINLRNELNNFKKELEENENALSAFENILRLDRHKDVKDYIETKYRDENKESQQGLRTWLDYCLVTRRIRKHLDKKMKEHGLFEEYQQYKINRSKDFKWEEKITKEVLKEYSSFLGSYKDKDTGQGIYLYLHEIAIFAYVLDKRVCVYTTLKDSLLKFVHTFNPDGKEEVTLVHDGINHIERLHINNALNDTDVAKVLSKQVGADTSDATATVWFNLANSLYRQEKYAEAEECYLTALKYDLSKNRKAILMSRLGDCCYIQNRYEEAKEAFFEATQYNPKNPCYWFALGTMQKKLEDFKNAQESYQKATEIEPTNAGYWINLWLSLVYLKKYKEAKHAFEQAIECDPDAMSWDNIDILMSQDYPEEYSKYEEAKNNYLRYIHKVVLNESIKRKIHWKFVNEMRDPQVLKVTDSQMLNAIDKHEMIPKNVTDPEDHESYNHSLQI